MTSAAHAKPNGVASKVLKWIEKGKLTARPRDVLIGERDLLHRLRTLHTIANATNQNDHNRIDFALAYALDELRLDQAYLGTIDAPRNELVMQNVIARKGVASYGPGKRYPLAETLIGRVVDSDVVFEAPDVVKARAAYGICYADEWKCYIAVAIRLAGQRYGAIGFKGRSVRDRGFSPIDAEFVQVTGDLIGASVERKLQRERLDALAFFDSLTGLPNRVLLTERLNQCIANAKRHSIRFALAFIDLDGFKGVNDSLGHAMGDLVLREFAARLQGAARDGDTVARLGGDEFVILLPHVGSATDAAHITARVVQAACGTLAIDGTSIEIRASAGHSVFPDDGVDTDALLASADAAMFRVKTRRSVRY